MTFQFWIDVLNQSLQSVWLGVAVFAPKLIGAVIVFVVGLVVASGLGSLVERLVALLKLDSVLEKVGVGEYVRRAGLQLNSARVLGQLIYWFLFIAFLLATADILEFSALSQFLRDVLTYIPNVVVAVLIVLAAVVLANFMRSLIMASVLSARMHAAKFLGSLTWWAVIIFGLSAALTQLGIAVAIVNTLITGLIAMLALAGGLAFGLGGKDYATDLIRKLRGQVESH